MTDIFKLKVEEIVSKIKDAQLTSVEVCKEYIDRIKNLKKMSKLGLILIKNFYLKKLRKPINIEDQVSQQVHYTVYLLL